MIFSFTSKALSGTILQHSQKKDDAKANVTSTEVEQISLTDRGTTP